MPAQIFQLIYFEISRSDHVVDDSIDIGCCLHQYQTFQLLLLWPALYISTLLFRMNTSLEVYMSWMDRNILFNIKHFIYCRQQVQAGGEQKRCKLARCLNSGINNPFKNVLNWLSISIGLSLCKRQPTNAFQHKKDKVFVSYKC